VREALGGTKSAAIPSGHVRRLQLPKLNRLAKNAPLSRANAARCVCAFSHNLVCQRHIRRLQKSVVGWLFRPRRGPGGRACHHPRSIALGSADPPPSCSRPALAPRWRPARLRGWEVGVSSRSANLAGSVAEYVDADDIDFSPWVAKEGPESAGDDGERLLARRAILTPVAIRDQEEEVLGVGCDVGLP
jgi:hypothetical protein